MLDVSVLFYISPGTSGLSAAVKQVWSLIECPHAPCSTTMTPLNAVNTCPYWRYPDADVDDDVKPCHFGRP